MSDEEWVEECIREKIFQYGEKKEGGKGMVERSEGVTCTSTSINVSVSINLVFLVIIVIIVITVITTTSSLISPPPVLISHLLPLSPQFTPPVLISHLLPLTSVHKEVPYSAVQDNRRWARNPLDNRLKIEQDLLVRHVTKG